MKQICIIATFCICLLVTKNVSAQKIAAPDVKVASDENALKPSAESAKTARLKQEEPKPPAMTLQKSVTTPQQTAAVINQPADITKDAKAIEIKPNTKKGQQLKNADRPKTSTIEPAKKTEPAAKPMPVVAPAIKGN